MKVTVLVTFFISLFERTYFEGNRKTNFEGLLDKARRLRTAIDGLVQGNRKI